MMKLPLAEQMRRLEEATEARARGRARRREQHAAEENPLHHAEHGKGKGGGGKGFGKGDGGKGLGKGDGGGKGKGKGKGKPKPPRPTDPEAPIAERRIAEADTQQADSAARSHGVATRTLQDALVSRNVGALSSALDDARAVSLGGPLVAQAEVLLLELQMEARTGPAGPSAAAPAPAPRPKRQQLRCEACGIVFFGAAELAGHICFAAMAGLDEGEEEAVTSSAGVPADEEQRPVEASQPHAAPPGPAAEPEAALVQHTSVAEKAPISTGALGLLCAYSDSEEEDTEAR